MAAVYWLGCLKLVACICAGVATLFSCLWMLRWVKHWHHTLRARHGIDAGLGQKTLSPAVPCLPFARLLLRLSFVDMQFALAEQLLREKRMIATRESIASWVCAICLTCSLFCAAALSSWAAAVCVPACLVALAMAYVHAAYEKQQELLRESVPNALRALEACFQSGFSLLQTFSQLSYELKGPLKLCFARAAHCLEMGYSVEDSLLILRETQGKSELAFVAVALAVQHESGGSMRKVLEAACQAVESEIDLVRSLRVQTAQAKLSARVISVLPFVLLAVFSLISEGFLNPFFSSVSGLVLLALALLMQMAGIFLVRRMLLVEVR